MKLFSFFLCKGNNTFIYFYVLSLTFTLVQKGIRRIRDLIFTRDESPEQETTVSLSGFEVSLTFRRPLPPEAHPTKTHTDLFRDTTVVRNIFET